MEAKEKKKREELEAKEMRKKEKGKKKNDKKKQQRRKLNGKRYKIMEKEAAKERQNCVVRRVVKGHVTMKCIFWRWQ